jgi:hypothetical protein
MKQTPAPRPAAFLPERSPGCRLQHSQRSGRPSLESDEYNHGKGPVMLAPFYKLGRKGASYCPSGLQPNDTNRAEQIASNLPGRGTTQFTVPLEKDVPAAGARRVGLRL